MPTSRAGSGRIHLITICFVKLTMERTERTTSAVPLPLALALHPFNRFTRLVWQIATAAQVLLALYPLPTLPTLPPVTTVDSPSLLLSPSLLCNPFNFRPNLKSNIDMCNSIASCCAGAERFVACGILYAFGQRGSGFAPLPPTHRHRDSFNNDNNNNFALMSIPLGFVAAEGAVGGGEEGRRQ